MAPVFPTVLAVVGDNFRRGTATAMGIVITCGWIGLVVSSPIIGFFQERTKDLGYALLLIPAFGVLMVVVNLVLRGVLQKRVTA